MTEIDEMKEIEPWMTMWILAGGLWCIFKWVSFEREGGRERVSLSFFAWIGMDPVPFRRKRPHSIVPFPDLPISLCFILGGVTLLLGVIPAIDSPMIMGWIGLVVMLCVLHFGLFDLIAAFWIGRGFPVKPIMNSPWQSHRLTEFWGDRWNRAFSDWARRNIFRPFVRRFGVTGGAMAGFLASGLAHELVISIPAKAGWGLPTLYFLIQWGMLALQKHYASIQGRLPTLAFVILPAPLLFHPPFLTDVMAPMVTWLVGNI